MPAYNGSLFCQPALRLLQFVRRKKLHWRATDSRSGKSQRKSLPTWLSDDGDLGNFPAMQKKKIEIVPPIHAALPALKLFKNNQQPRFRSGVDLTGECALLCGKFGSFQSAADSEHINVVRLILDLNWHVCSLFYFFIILKCQDVHRTKFDRYFVLLQTSARHCSYQTS